MGERENQGLGLNIEIVSAQSTLDGQAQMQANGTYCWEWKCSHWTQATSKELPAKWRARLQCGLEQERLTTLYFAPGVSFLNVDLRALLRVLTTYPLQLLGSEKLPVVSHQFHKKVV